MATAAISLLLIEDDSEDYELARRLLSRSAGGKYRITWAKSAEEAARTLEAEDFDVVLMDYFLGGSTGLDLLTELPGRLYRCPIVMFTSGSETEMDRVSMDLGIEFFISKQDLNERVLDRTIRHAIHNKELKRRMSAFAKIVSHDTLGPVRRIGSLLELVEEEAKDTLSPPAREILQMARRESENLRAMLGSLSDYLIKEGAAPRPELCDLGEVARNAILFLESSIEERGARVELGDLPTVWADPSHLLHVFMNLMQNALKYSAKETPSIEISAESTERSAIVRVVDDGIGFEPRHAKRIFEPLVRLHAREEYEGTGFGLSICKEFIEKSGGRIWAESAPGAGSTFCFELPRAKG